MTIYGFREKMAGKIVRAANQNARDNRGTKKGRDRWQETRSAEVNIAKVTTVDPLTVDIYRGEGANEKKIHEDVTDVQLNSDYKATVNQRLLAIKIRGTWELYMIVDGVSEGYEADTQQALTKSDTNELEWGSALPAGTMENDILIWDAVEEEWVIGGVSDSEIGLSPQLQLVETDPDNPEFQIRMKGVKLAVNNGTLEVQAGNYGEWVSLDACPPDEEES